MNSKIIIGIPIHSFDNPMSRLSNSVDLKTRRSLQKALLVNTVNSFKAENMDIFLISNSHDVKIIADELDVRLFRANVSGLNHEIIEFTTLIKNYQSWSICHADLPYLNKFNISVFLNEIFAIHSMRYVQSKGLKIPEDISFIGFTDGLLSKYASPGLTAIAQHGEQMGEIAAEILIDKVENDMEEETYVTRVLEPTMIERGSTVN